jgi:hypothetical protein
MELSLGLLYLEEYFREMIFSLWMFKPARPSGQYVEHQFQHKYILHFMRMVLERLVLFQ